MTSEIRPVSVQKVIAILTKAGHTKAEGTFLTTFKSGFVARKEHRYPLGDVIRVTHRDSRRDYGQRYDDSAELTAYRASLEAAGVVIIPDEFVGSALLCTGVK